MPFHDAPRQLRRVVAHPRGRARAAHDVVVLMGFVALRVEIHELPLVRRQKPCGLPMCPSTF
eukprot:5190386-Pyramimonas_sp.AAC.1